MQAVDKSLDTRTPCTFKLLLYFATYLCMHLRSIHLCQGLRAHYIRVLTMHYTHTIVLILCMQLYQPVEKPLEQKG